MDPDLLRWLLFYGSCLVAGGTLFVFVEATLFRWPPWPLRLLALSYLAYSLYIPIDVLARHGDPITWRGFLGLGIVGYSLGALVLASVYYRPSARKRRHDKLTEQATAAIWEELRRRQREGEPEGG